MERIRNVLRRGLAPTLIAFTAAVTLGPTMAHAQFGGTPSSYTLRVVDQNGLPLDGSMVRIEGTTGDLTTPATVDLFAGPQLITIEPAVLGAMLPGGSTRPGGANGLSRNEFVFLNPGGGQVNIVWRTADVTVSVVDQDGAAIAGARWGFAGDGASYESGTLTLPVTDESQHMGMGGPSLGGWIFDVRAAFSGTPIDLLRSEARESTMGLTAIALEWRQTSCTMGVVDATDSPIRGATWAVFGQAFNAGDAITLPTTDESVYPDLSGALASGFPVFLFTNTSFGSADATFEMDASGSLSPAFADVNGGAFGLRCGITAFPPLTDGALAVSVTADGAAYAGAQLSLVDANGGTASLTTGADGTVGMTGLPQGPLALTLTVPTGYHAVDPASGSIATSILPGETRNVSFAIALDTEPPKPPTPVNTPESYNYWRREVSAALRGSGRRDENPQDMAVKFPEEIFAGFALHETDPVRVEGVTQIDPDGTGPMVARRLTLADMDLTLDPGGSDALHAAKRELLVVLLNLVSGRLTLNLVIDAEGHTLDWEIRRIAALINDGMPTNDPIARGAAERINSGRAGMRAPIREVGPHVAVTPVAEEVAANEEPLALAATRSAGSIRLAFTLAEAQSVTLDVYDASGRRQARLYAGDAPAGTTELTWNGNGRRGVYFARLVTPQGVRSTKVVAW